MVRFRIRTTSVYRDGVLNVHQEQYLCDTRVSTAGAQEAQRLVIQTLNTLEESLESWQYYSQASTSKLLPLATKSDEGANDYASDYGHRFELPLARDLRRRISPASAWHCISASGCRMVGHYKYSAARTTSLF